MKKCFSVLLTLFVVLSLFYVSCRGDKKEGVLSKTKDYEYVDLGLSVKWATCNVGATNPWECGDYYAWGEVKVKDNYDWSTYKWFNGAHDAMTKYCKNSRKGRIDNKQVLDYSDDVARVKWGGRWRMPTEVEQEELRENCKWDWCTLNGVYGCKVTSNINGNSIFLPAAGIRIGAETYIKGSDGRYWSSSLYGSACEAYCLIFENYYGSDWLECGRCSGLTVRPVCE